MRRRDLLLCGAGCCSLLLLMAARAQVVAGCWPPPLLCEAVSQAPLFTTRKATTNRCATVTTKAPTKLTGVQRQTQSPSVAEERSTRSSWYNRSSGIEQACRLRSRCYLVWWEWWSKWWGQWAEAGGSRGTNAWYWYSGEEEEEEGFRIVNRMLSTYEPALCAAQWRCNGVTRPAPEAVCAG